MHPYSMIIVDMNVLLWTLDIWWSNDMTNDFPHPPSHPQLHHPYPDMDTMVTNICDYHFRTMYNQAVVQIQICFNCSNFQFFLRKTQSVKKIQIMEFQGTWTDRKWLRNLQSPPDSRYVGSDAILMCKIKCMIFETVYVNVQDMMLECWCCPAENQSFLAGPDSYNNIARDW